MTKHFTPLDIVVLQRHHRAAAAAAAVLTPSQNAIRFGLLLTRMDTDATERAAVFALVSNDATERSMALSPREARAIAARLVGLADACEAATNERETKR